MNLALTSCRSPFLDDDKIYAPMANLYLKSYLEKHVPEVKITLLDDNYDLDNPTTFSEYDLVGISIMTPQREQSTALLHAIKKHSPSTKVIAGGPHCRYYLSEAEAEPYDYLVPLDGERSLVQIVRGNAPRIVRDVMGVKDILDAPRPDRSSADAVALLKGYHYTLQGKPATTMMTARGCPEKCLSGDTIIHTTEGNIPIKELVGRKEVGIFTFDKNTNRVFVTLATNIKKTGSNRDLVRVEFDDGTHIDCTPDHRIMTFINKNQYISDIRYAEKQAWELKAGNRVKAIKFSKSHGYWWASWARKGRDFVHRLLGEYKTGRQLLEGEIVHHLNGIKTDNRLINLCILKNSSEHFLEHGQEARERMTKNNPAKKLSKEYFLKLGLMNRGKKRSYESRLRYRESKLGTKNPNYKNGLTTGKSRITLENDGIVNHKVVRVYPIGNGDVYDLEVPVTHWFFANNILVHNCTFCEASMTVVKWSNLSNLDAEMQDIKNLGYQGAYIFDDLFAIAMPKVRPICDLFKKHGLVYRCNGQVRYFTKWEDQFAKMLADSGCVEMAFGFESGSQLILDNVKKRTTVAMNYKAVQYAKAQGIHVKGFVMIGLPGETRDTIQETEAFIRDAGMDDFQLSVYAPFKGTQIRDAIDRGTSDVDLVFEGEKLMAYGQKGGKSEACVRTAALSSDELLQIRDDLVKKYKPLSHGQLWQEDHFFDIAKRKDLKIGS